MIVIDTSALVDSFTGHRNSEKRLGSLVESGERIILTAIVYYEWRRGPRLREELAFQEQVFPMEAVVPFDAADATLAANLYRSVRSPRTREIDIAIAAMALARDASLWTLNLSDFTDIPGLQLIRTHPSS